MKVNINIGKSQRHTFDNVLFTLVNTFGSGAKKVVVVFDDRSPENVSLEVEADEALFFEHEVEAVDDSELPQAARKMWS